MNYDKYDIEPKRVHTWNFSKEELTAILSKLLESRGIKLPHGQEVSTHGYEYNRGSDEGITLRMEEGGFIKDSYTTYPDEPQ